MSALADILESLGHHVTGTDQTISAMEIAASSLTNPQRKMIPWDTKHLPPESTDVCVFTPALTADNPLRQRVSDAGIRTLSLHECLAELFQSKRHICVAGTHGKTTTSAMLSWILQQSNTQPSFFVGGELIDTQSSGTFGNGDCAVLESCEFSRSFQHFRPQTIVLTGIERDHFDCFPAQHDEDDAFRNFVSQLSDQGTVIINADCSRSKEVVSGANDVQANVVRFGIDISARPDWLAIDTCIHETKTSFVCRYQGTETPVQLKVPGRHNVKNALAAMAAAAENGISPVDSATALRTFSGVRRRFEYRGRVNGFAMIDDYGHHPTAIRETLLTARAVFPGQRLILVFEPHQVVRTRSLFPDFVESLKLADETLLLPVFPARENISHPECCRTSGQLVKELNRRDSKAFLFANLDQIVSRIDHSGRPSDVFITMGAGKTNLIYDQLIRRLQRHSVA